MNDLVIPASGSPISKVILTSDRVVAAFLFACEATRSDTALKRKALAEIQQILPMIPAIMELVGAAARPASKPEIATFLAQLLKAYPNTGKEESNAFGRLLLEDVIDEKPSMGAMEAGCRKVRQTSRFLPVIAEVLTAVREAETLLRGTLSRIEMLPLLAEELGNQIAEGERMATLRSSRQSQFCR